MDGEQKQRGYPQVLFLGTGSALPSDTRSITSILISVSDTKSLLLDSGEHTIGQLTKYFGPLALDAELVKIKCLFISHCHLDHFNGMYGVIKARQQAFTRLGLRYEKLALVFPRTLTHMTHIAPKLVFTENFNNDLVQCVPVELLLFDEKQRENEIKHSQFLSCLRYIDMDKFFESLGVIALKSVMVPHIHFSYGICLNLKVENKIVDQKSDGLSADDDRSKEFKLVFSGDCRPSDELVKAGKDCDLLIHECTFDNANHDKAVRARHSTIGEALDVSKRMGAKHTLLTHFSQRYSKFVITDDMNVENCAFAFDFMCVTPDEMDLLSKKTVSKLNVIFKEKILDYENTRMDKRLLRPKTP